MGSATSSNFEAPGSPEGPELLRRAEVYDRCVSPFEEKFVSKPSNKSSEKSSAASRSLFALKDTSEKKEVIVAVDDSKTYYDDLPLEEKSKLLSEIFDRGFSLDQQATVVPPCEAVEAPSPAPEGRPPLKSRASHYKLDVYDLVKRSQEIENLEERAKIMDNVREIVLSAVVSATKLSAAMRGRNARRSVGNIKKGKKQKGANNKKTTS